MKPRIICVVGPTASGKTAVALELAEHVGGEIVSADSRQLYRGLDVGTAKPTAAERARVRHHCLDLADPGEPFDAARFRQAAAEAIDDIAARGRVPLVVGGTGLYVRVLLRGLCPAPSRVPAVRAALEAEAARDGRAALHARLAALDPASAARLAPRDTVRVVRALEVALTTGVPLSRWQAEHAFGERPYDALVLGLERPPAELAQRIAARAREMVAAGFLDEVRGLRTRGIDVDAVGYPEMAVCVDGRADLESALAATIAATRRFAKRQRTWFAREPGIVWHHPERDAGSIAAAATVFLAGADATAAAPPA
ncbi:MAG TPA: tRNA (adenosine(37)-N6)-dimethylallyltransferase MiaA [Candidatus Binatia bacterium]|nr:tRNA (adenosine(37)-N6)-dimethylallyltransferase MiaA [Candidatus Binatia bacterium]